MTVLLNFVQCTKSLDRKKPFVNEIYVFLISVRYTA